MSKDGDLISPRRHMLRLPSGALNVHLLAAYLSCCNRLEEAADPLVRARSEGHRSAETTKLLIDIFFRSGKQAAALALAQVERAHITPEEWHSLEAALALAGNSARP